MPERNLMDRAAIFSVPGFRIEAVALYAGERRPTMDQARLACQMLARQGRGIQFWVGDLLNIAEGLFGETYADIIEMTNWEPDTIDRYQSVCAAVQPETRRADLFFSHHRAVAHLPNADQRTWLDRAAAENWSGERLAKEIRGAASDGGGGAFWVTVSCVDAADQEALADRLSVEGRQVKKTETKVKAAA